MSLCKLKERLKHIKPYESLHLLAERYLVVDLGDQSTLNFPLGPAKV